MVEVPTSMGPTVVRTTILTRSAETFFFEKLTIGSFKTVFPKEYPDLDMVGRNVGKEMSHYGLVLFKVRSGRNLVPLDLFVET